MATVEQSLAAWAISASGEQLERGPSVDDLGGYDAVLEEATTLAVGPHLPYLLMSLAHSIQSLTQDQAEELAAAIVPGLRQPHAAWVLSDPDPRLVFGDRLWLSLIVSGRCDVGCFGWRAW